ncbi:hypothetical protein [Caulobacter sp.]|uniref:DUF6894 family protein n=1 Tax=Caulobacter sp. TaxID=78 RepID=UPI001B063655|nr:hypothetical protein [Caulobacter sp.]MBO9547278.1 hypothetical protein [Caulobacter sp.]
MSTYHFDIDSEGAATTEQVEAADPHAAIRQALLLVSEILRDHALSQAAAMTLTISVRGPDGQVFWRGGASGGPAGAEPAATADARQGARKDLP